MKFSIVIPVYNQYKLLHQLLYDIYQNCSPVDEVIIVDDCSTELEVAKGVDWWMTQAKMLPITYYKTKKNQGFLLTSNYGLKKAKGDIVCLISTDVRIHGDIVKYSIDNLYTEEWTDKEDKFYTASFMGGRLIDWDSGWNTFQNHTYVYLEGWLLTAYKKDWKMIGHFDERFTPNDCEDLDLGAKMDLWGWKFLTYPDGSVSHIGAQSIGYNPEREEITKINKEKFRKKWLE